MYKHENYIIMYIYKTSNCTRLFLKSMGFVKELLEYLVTRVGTKKGQK